MKILLIAPTSHYNHHYPSFVPFLLFPTGFAYLAAALKEAGHQVSGLNPNNITGYPSAFDMIKDKITQAIENTKPDMIGIGGLCTDYLFIKDSINIVRYLDPNIKIVLGGGIITNDAEYIFNLLKPDLCVIGEGEEAIVSIANDINPVNIPNIGYWKNDKAIFTEQNFNYKDIESIPFPDYDPFNVKEMAGDYVVTAAWVYRYTRIYPKPWTIITARSCPFSCTFCVHSRGPRYRARSIENILEEIKISYEKYHFNILILLDELTAVNKTRMKEFCIALIAAKKKYGWDFDWSFNTHASANLDKETLLLAKKSGCFFFSYGMESASPAVLASMNKKTKPAQISTAIKLSEEVKLCFGGNFIFGDPAETEKTLVETLDFMVHYCLDINIILNALRPYPGSKIFDVCIERGLITDKLDFYEHIDQRPWDMSSNMTSIPNKRWIPLLDSIVAFGQLLPWVKPVIPYHYEVDTTSINSPIVLQTGKQIYKIRAKCPHCKADIYCRELLMLDKPITKSLAKPDIKLFRDAVIKAIRLFTLYYFSFTHPAYRLLKSSVQNKNLLLSSFFTTIFFGTGCSNCHRKVRITIPIPFTLKSFSFAEIRRKFNLSDA
jgi:radical SAM superfamily enzyme YgiQ (UPF0313 family)